MNIDMEVAISILNKMIGKKIKEGYDIESEEINNLKEDVKKVYLKDEETLNKVLNEYSKLLK